MATFNDEVTLIGKSIVGYDDYGNQIKKDRYRTVLCNKLSVFSNEFYNAATIGLKPQFVLSVHAFEYEGEEKILYRGNEYDILRTYEKNGLLELTVGDKIGN